MEHAGLQLLRKDESPVHGAEIFAGYLADDREFVKQVEEM